MATYAGYLLRRFNTGESVAELIASEGVPRERIIMRLKAAFRYEQARRSKGRFGLPHIPRLAAA